MSEVINWLKAKPSRDNLFIYAFGGSTMSWEDGDSVDSAAKGVGADDVTALNWVASGNAIKLADKQIWMDTISEVFAQKEFKPYEWKTITHPNDDNVDIDYFNDKDGDTWFAIFNYNHGRLPEADLTKQDIKDKLDDAFGEQA